MRVIADIHLHSKYSRAVSQEMVLPVMSRVAKQKGIDLLSTGDWMHPVWMSEIKAGLEEWSEGVYVSKENSDGAKFILTAEISNIYSQGGKGRRVHTLVFSPNIETCLKVNEELMKRGCNLSSDGRPIVGLSCIELAELVFSIDEKCLLLPCHVWTPWFSLYGSKSGFDSIEECFGKYAESIYAVETGLSSDPVMNWRIRELEKRAIVSFSDAHSPPKLGRELTVFEGKGGVGKYTYNDIYEAMASRYLGKNEGNLEILYTIEFYPEEGKYHWDGHRKCKVIHSPEDTRRKGSQCPVCGRPLTVGVEYRVDQLASKELIDIEELKKENEAGVVEYFHPNDKTRPPYVKLVPLLEILAEVKGVGVNSKTVKGAYQSLMEHFGSEFKVLLESGEEELGKQGGERLAEAIARVRKGKIVVRPGYDGVFGKVSIWSDDEEEEGKKEQMSFFG